MSARLGGSLIAGAAVLLGPSIARADVGDAPPAPFPEPVPVVVVPNPYPPPYFAPPPPPAPAPVVRGFSFKAWAGPAYRRVYDVPISAGEFGLAFGAQKGFYGDIGVLLGRTDQGLFVYQLRPQATGEARLGPVRLGLGLGFTMIGIHRATERSDMLGVGLAATAFATVDLYSSGGHALYLGGKMALDWLPGNHDDTDALMWGPSAVLGWRY